MTLTDGPSPESGHAEAGWSAAFDKLATSSPDRERLADLDCAARAGGNAPRRPYMAPPAAYGSSPTARNASFGSV